MPVRVIRQFAPLDAYDARLDGKAWHEVLGFDQGAIQMAIGVIVPAEMRRAIEVLSTKVASELRKAGQAAPLTGMCAAGGRVMASLSSCDSC